MATIKPPFTLETAREKMKFAQSMWNTRNPTQVAKGYTPDCIWRNRDLFIRGTDEIVAFLTRKWQKEVNYRLRKELFCFGSGDIDSATGEPKFNKIAVQFWYEYQDAEDGMKWKRCYGLEDWTFEAEDGGKMRKRMMSGNDVVLGRNGDGVAVPEEGIEGRWYVDGMDVEDVVIGEKHY